MGAEITRQKQGDAYQLNLRGSFNEDVQQITAYYNVKDDSTQKTKKVLLGALNVISYDQIKKELVLVPVNGNKTIIPQVQLRDSLNKAYSPANVQWTVSLHAGVQVEYSDDMSQGLDDGESKMLSNYTKEMNKVIKALKRSDKYDKHKVYMFLIDKAQTANKEGFMPKKRPWGFVFTDIHSSNIPSLYRTIAHEVAHGEFRLSHPFQEFPSIPKRSTQNLMDYADGQQLRKYQWDDIHNLRDVELYGQDEAGNASMANCTWEKVKEYFLQEESYTKLVARKKVYDNIYINFEDLMEKLEANAKAEKKEEVEDIEGWSLRASTLSENKKGFLYERILKKLEDSENDKEVSFNLSEKGIYLGKAKIGEENYNLAIYCDNDTSVIKKVQLKDYCELINNEEVNKQIKVAEIGDYLLLAFFKDEKIEMVVQFMSDDDDEFKKLLIAFKVLKGEEKFEEEKESDESKPKVPISVETFKDIEYFKDTPEERIKEVVNAVNKYSNEYKIDSKERMAHFLGQISVETGGLKSLKEDGKYNERRIVEVFPWVRNGHLYEEAILDDVTKTFRYYPVMFDIETCVNNKVAKGNVVFDYTESKELINAYGDTLTDITEKVMKNGVQIDLKYRFFAGRTDLYRNGADKSKHNLDENLDPRYKSGKLKIKEDYVRSENLFDVVYACNYGNGNISSQDGSRYKGVGFIHLTWKDNFKTVYDIWQNKEMVNRQTITLDEFAEKMADDVEVAIEAAMIYWELKGINSFADKNDYSGVTNKINSSKLGLDDRTNNTNDIKDNM